MNPPSPLPHTLRSLLAIALGASACLDTAEPGAPCIGGAPTTRTSVRMPLYAEPVEDVDILFEVDNSCSMSENQANLSRSFGALVEALTSPPVDPMTSQPRSTPVRSLHLGVITSDLGTPGSVIPSCANSDVGDDGLLNPIRNGAALRLHYPWTTAPPGRRPMRCTMDPGQFPSFLRFDRMTSDPAVFREEFICNAYLSIGGCGLEQQLESMYRALVVHNPRAVVGNTDPNAGFVRDNAVLALMMLTDEEDGSTRDCRYAERGVPCTDAVSVFDITASQWSSNDLNLRFYNYVPGSAQDPTWPIDRYIDPRDPRRGFLGLKPGRPELVTFSAIAGVPIQLPTRGDRRVDWNTLLGARPDGYDGYVGMSDEGPISMRQRNMDPMCSTRVVPACRREGTVQSSTCDSASQYFAWPSRRIAQVARRFDELYHNGTLSSVCKRDYSDGLRDAAERILARLSGRCLARDLPLVAAPCEAGDARGMCSRTSCVVREILPDGVTAAAACTAARGRTPSSRDASLQRDTCLVQQLAAPRGMTPPAGRTGFFYDERLDPLTRDCRRRVTFTDNAALLPGAVAVIECSAEVSAPSTQAACQGAAPVGASCTPTRPGAAAACDTMSSAGCFVGSETYLEAGSRACATGLCLSYRYDERADVRGVERADRVACTCRCGVPPSLRGSVPASSLCACPAGMACVPVAGEAYPTALQGSYCVRAGL